jgi:hypothetical protein
MIYKSLHRKLKSVQHQPYQNPWDKQLLSH